MATRVGICRRNNHSRCETSNRHRKTNLTADDVDRPEFMGVLPALGYILAMVIFVPFVFKSGIMEMTSSTGVKDEALEAPQNETGRFLHLFPPEKVCVVLFPLSAVRHC